MTTNPPPVQSVIATVTGNDLLARLDSISTSVAHLTAKIDDIPLTLHDHEGRIRLLEQWRWKGAGIAAVVSGLMSSGIVAAIVTAKK